MSKAPDAFRTISEAADEMGLPQHVLRFWETKFPQIKPLKRGGGRRYYRPQDIELLRGIKYFLYDEGYTIKGLQKLIKERGARFICAMPDGLAEASLAQGQGEISFDGEGGEDMAPQPGQHLEQGVAALVLSERQKADLRQALSSLEEARTLLASQIRLESLG